MFFPGGRTKLVLVALAGTILVAGILWSTLNRPAINPTTTGNHNTDPVRQRYADLYEAAWRQDEGRGNVALTATLFGPPLIELLGRDAGRSEVENQLYRAVKETTDRQIAIYLTIDTVGGPQTDQSVKDSLTLTTDQVTYYLASWKPLIVPGRVVNTVDPVYSQSGVATFVADRTIAWTDITNLRLTSRNLGGIPARTFVWAVPGLLLVTPE